MADGGGINLAALSLEQLNQLRQSIEEVSPMMYGVRIHMGMESNLKWFLAP